MNHDVLVNYHALSELQTPPLREHEFRIRPAAGGESTHVVDRPINEMDALMRTAPGDTPEQTLEQVQRLREAVVDAMDALTDQQRFILDAVHSERLSARQLAPRLGLEKSQAHRLLQEAEAALRTQLVLNPLIRERLNMLTPTLPALTVAEVVEPTDPPAPTTWDEAARRIVSSMVHPEDDMPVSMALVLIERKIEMLRDMVNQGHVGTKQLGQPLVTLGVAAAHILKAQGLWHVDEMVALLCRKQHDYGHANILSFGQVGVAVRCSDKVARYINLTAKGAAGAAEPTIDAVLDMVGYAVIAQMLMDGTFILELDDSQWGQVAA